MIDFKALELPIEKAPVDGPAVKALASRKEANDHHKVTGAELKKSYAKVKRSLMSGLKTLGSAKV
jgi:hypothetical protein